MSLRFSAIKIQRSQHDLKHFSSNDLTCYPPSFYSTGWQQWTYLGLIKIRKKSFW